jgi:hypothetical protein
MAKHAEFERSIVVSKIQARNVKIEQGWVAWVEQGSELLHLTLLGLGHSARCILHWAVLWLVERR